MIKSSVKKQINDAIHAINESTHDSMFQDAGTKNAITFCEIKKIAEANNMSLIVDASVWGYKGAEATDDINVSIVLVKPCCLGHMLEELTDEFIELFFEEYGELPYCRQYFLENIRVKSITNNLISVELELGT